MKQVNEVIKDFNNKYIKQNLLVYEAYKNVANKQIVDATIELFYKDGVLFITAKNNTWGQQIAYYKQKLFNGLKKEIKSIKDIKISVDIMTEEITDPVYRNRCKKCESYIISEADEVCVVCKNIEENQKKLIVNKLLKETPWIGYSDVNDEIKKVISQSEFLREKKFQKERIYDNITMSYWDFIQQKGSVILNSIKAKIEEYVLLSCEIMPEQITDEIIKQNIPAKIFKMYISKEK